ncbi:MAG: CBS domain-containing protein [Chthoniobacterales bacterium]
MLGSGVLARHEIETRQFAGTRRIFPLAASRTGQSIRESQALLIQSTTGTIAVTDDANKLLGIVTLHDLLRAQLGVAEREGK